MRKPTGTGGGSSKSSSFYASYLKKTVYVVTDESLPFQVQITFREGVISQPLILDESTAHLLWVALSKLADVEKWEKET